MRPRSCNALTVFRVADRDRVNFAVFESAQQHIAAQQFGLKLIAVLQVREQPVRFRSSRKAPQSTLVLCQVVTVCALLPIESGSSTRKLSRNGLRGDLLQADLWPGITSGLPFAQNPKVMPDIESKLNLLMVSFARRRGDAAEFVDGVEQGNESFVFRLSVFLALWTISHCEALAIGFKIEVSRWMTAFTSLLLPYRPPRCTCRISR